MLLMEMLPLLLPAVFALRCHKVSEMPPQTSSGGQFNSSYWECRNVTTGCTCLVASATGNERKLLQKCVLDCNAVNNTVTLSPLPVLDVVAANSKRETGETSPEDISFLLRFKRDENQMVELSANTTVNSTNTSKTCSKSKLRFSKTRKIANLVVYILTFTLGLVLNGTLLYIYLKHKELRTRRNALFINLTLADIVFILVFAVFQISSFFTSKGPSCFEKHLCRFYVFCACVSAAVGIYSVAFISIQRYCGIVKFNNPVIKKAAKILVRPTGLLTTIWTLSILLALPEAARSRYSNNKEFRCGNPNIFMHGAYPFVLYGVLPVAITAIFYFAVRKRPVDDASSNEFLRSFRNRTERVLLSLGVVYLLTYIPALICDIVSKPKSGFWNIFCHISTIMYILNPILCPVALCVASRRLRRYFVRHLLCCVSSKDVDTPSRPQTALFILGTLNRVNSQINTGTLSQK